MSREQELKNQIDNYKDTLFAIVGFMNLYRFDDQTRTMRGDVVVFQGRRLDPVPENDGETENEVKVQADAVTPDIGILLPNNTGVLGEVKATFPNNRALWISAFEQLMSYDQELSGWPNSAGTVNTHDVVLLVHYTRAVAVRKFYEEKKGTEINFTRPFCIIEFHRVDQAREYFSLRTQLGAVSNPTLNSKLEESVPIPMSVYVQQYSTHKLYDSNPPTPYLLDLIWSHIVTLEASANSKFTRLRKNQSIDVELGVDQITNRLYEQFSFYTLHSDHTDRQPKTPRKAWVRDACDRLIASGDATWIGESRERIKFKFIRRDDVLDYFIKLCSQEAQAQISLFEDQSRPESEGEPGRNQGVA